MWEAGVAGEKTDNLLEPNAPLDSATSRLSKSPAARDTTLSSPALQAPAGLECVQLAAALPETPVCNRPNTLASP